MIPRFVPSLRVLRIVAWLAFCPVAFVASHASLVAALFVIGAFLPLVSKRMWASLIGAGVVLNVTASIETSLLSRPLGFAVALAAGLTFLWLMRRAHASEERRLDAPVHALEPFALCLAMAGVFVAHGAQAAHLHATFPNVARVLVALAVITAAVSVLAWRGLGIFVGRVYRGNDRELRVRALVDDVDAPLVSELAPSARIDAAIVEHAASATGPYRADEGRVVARVPSDPSALARRHRNLAIQAFGTTLVCAAAIGLVVPPLSNAAHPSDLATASTKLPPLPGKCSGQRVKLRFVPVAPLRVLDIEEIAARYSSADIANVVVEKPFAFQERWLDQGRRQIIGEDVLRDARKQYPPLENEMVIAVTDRDMFLRDVEWRFAFATRDSGVAVVSIARMDPSFPLLAPMTYVPQKAECSALVRARAFKMITRQVLFGLCAAGMADDPRSARRQSVLGMSDLDAIDEATY